MAVSRRSKLLQGHLRKSVFLNKTTFIAGRKDYFSCKHILSQINNRMTNELWHESIIYFRSYITVTEIKILIEKCFCLGKSTRAAIFFRQFDFDIFHVFLMFECCDVDNGTSVFECCVFCFSNFLIAVTRQKTW